MSGGADESGGMGACGGGPARCVPGTVTLENGEEKMREAGEQIQRGGSLVMDMSASGDCDSAALGAMIEWRRMAEERKCRLSFENIDGRLAKLAQLYQVADLLGMGEAEGEKGAGE